MLDFRPLLKENSEIHDGSKLYRPGPGTHQGAVAPDSRTTLSRPVKRTSAMIGSLASSRGSRPGGCQQAKGLAAATRDAGQSKARLVGNAAVSALVPGLQEPS